MKLREWRILNFTQLSKIQGRQANMFNLIVYFLIAKYVLYRMSRDDYEKKHHRKPKFRESFSRDYWKGI